MKVGSKIVFLLRDSEGFGEAISAAFRRNPSNSTVEESFELSLERYGIKNCKASGILHNFLDPQGQYELVRVLKLPTYVLIGQRGQRISDKEEFQILNEIGELLASTLNLSFSRDKITWNPTRKSKDDREPWRALYG